MGDYLVVLYNVLNGPFITHSQNLTAFDESTNPRVPAYDQIIVLKEFAIASFIRVDKELERAETPSFFFYKFNEDIPDDIIWVETREGSVDAQ